VIRAQTAWRVAWVAIALVATTSCGDDRADIDDLRRSGVGIVAEGCGLTAQLASGVVLERTGQVITVAHAIAGATGISVVDHTGNAHSATVRAFDKDRDLAVLDVPALDAPALDLASAEIGPAGILTWTRDDGVVYDAVEVTKHLEITIEDIYIEETVERNGIEIAGDIRIGDSGGPVLSSTGDVVGTIYANSRDRDEVGFATDASELEAVLNDASDVDVANGRCG
jgi:S1-C subfamily serine protease